MTATYVCEKYWKKTDTDAKFIASATIFWLKLIYPCLMFLFYTTSPSEK